MIRYLIIPALLYCTSGHAQLVVHNDTSEAQTQAEPVRPSGFKARHSLSVLASDPAIGSLPIIYQYTPTKAFAVEAGGGPTWYVPQNMVLFNTSIDHGNPDPGGMGYNFYCGIKGFPGRNGASGRTSVYGSLGYFARTWYTSFTNQEQSEPGNIVSHEIPLRAGIQWRATPHFLVNVFIGYSQQWVDVSVYSFQSGETERDSHSLVRQNLGIMIGYEF